MVDTHLGYLTYMYGTKAVFFSVMLYAVAMLLKQTYLQAVHHQQNKSHHYRHKLFNGLNESAIYDEKLIQDINNRLAVSVELSGNLGDVMFQFAFGYVLSKNHSVRLVLRSSESLELLKNAFDADFSQYQVDWPNQIFSENFVTKTNKFDCAFDEEMVKRPQTFTNYIGLFRSWKYFDHYKNEIRWLFKLKEHIKRRAHASLVSLVRIRDNSTTPWGVQTVAMTVNRHTLSCGTIKVHKRSQIHDNSSSVTRRLSYPIPSIEYYEKAMKYMREKLKSPVFIVSTDDHSWTHHSFANHTDMIILKGTVTVCCIAYLLTLFRDF